MPDIVISIEIEMGWSMNGLGSVKQAAKLPKAKGQYKECLTRLLSLADEYGVKLSFDVVGHLMLDDCSGTHSGEYPENWFAEDHSISGDNNSLRHAPELIGLIQDDNVGHEICTHTFSHIPFEDVSKKTAMAELEKVNSQFEEWGIDGPKSLVPPRHQAPPKDVLRDAGIEIIRIPFPDGADVPPDNKLRQGLWWAIREHPLQDPQIKDGIVETYCTTFESLTAVHISNGPAPPKSDYFRKIPMRLRQAIQTRFLQSAVSRAIKYDTHLHLWTHLFNLAHEDQWPPIRRLFLALAEAKTQGLRTVTMQELNRRVRKEA